MAWVAIDELGVGSQADKELLEGLRGRVLAFEHERQLILQALASLLRCGGGDNIQSQGSMSGRDNTVPVPKKGLGDLQAVRETANKQAGQIWQLRCQRGAKSILLYGDQLSNLQHQHDLDLLQLSRVLDRERILELLRLTDPQRGLPQEQSRVNRRARSPRPRPWGVEAEEIDLPPDEDEDEQVPASAITELEKRVQEMRARVVESGKKTRALVTSKLGERAQTEGQTRPYMQGSLEAIEKKQQELRQAEDRLSQTVLDYLTLRHNALHAQRVSTEGKQAVQAMRARHQQEVERDTVTLQRENEAMRREAEASAAALAKNLEKQIQLREVEMCMLKEQQDQTARLYQERRAKLADAVAVWRRRYGQLRRRYSLEVEGFQRDADELGRTLNNLKRLSTTTSLGSQARPGRFSGGSPSAALREAGDSMDTLERALGAVTGASREHW